MVLESVTIYFWILDRCRNDSYNPKMNKIFTLKVNGFETSAFQSVSLLEFNPTTLKGSSKPVQLNN